MRDGIALALRALALAGLLLAAPLLPGAAAAGGEDDVGLAVYRSPYDFETSAENLENAILAQGLVISNTLHVHDMLARTGADLGRDEGPYLAGIAHEFCSAAITHRMTARDPHNIATCPFTIAVYELRADPGRAWFAFQRRMLAGNAADLEDEIFRLLETIVEEARF